MSAKDVFMSVDNGTLTANSLVASLSSLTAADRVRSVCAALGSTASLVTE
jgi:hypothetical protein